MGRGWMANIGVEGVCPTTAEGSNDLFCVFEIWHKSQIISNVSNI